jgi:hypothetical protein
MPVALITAAASDDPKNLMNSLAADCSFASDPIPIANTVVSCRSAGRGPTRLDAFHRNDFADLLDRKLDLAPGDELGIEAHAVVQFRLSLHFLGDPQAFQHLCEVDTAWRA